MFYWKLKNLKKRFYDYPYTILLESWAESAALVLLVLETSAGLSIVAADCEPLTLPRPLHTLAPACGPQTTPYVDSPQIRKLRTGSS